MDALLPAIVAVKRKKTANQTMEEIVKTTLHIGQQALSSSGALSSLFRPPKRNLGCGILVAAIEDYLSLDEQAQAGAARFLYPTEPDYREHYDWVVSMAAGVNAVWLREALDEARAGWDRRRMEKKLEQQLAQRLRARLTA